MKTSFRTRYGMPLWLAITLALVVKLSLLYLIWYAFFSMPQAKHMRMPTPQVEQHLLATDPPKKR